jgi:hypothetical protein
MLTAFLAERTTRDLARRLGQFALDDQTRHDIVEQGQGLMIGNCEVDRTIKKIARAIRNVVPTQLIVACHSYELAGRVCDECNELTISALLLWSDQKPPATYESYSVVITVPENLHRLRSAVKDKSFCPSFLFLFDPNGTTFRGRSAQDGGGHRAANISIFRGACLALGCPVLPIICVSVSPAAFSLDSICQSTGVEALIYADGATLRTAITTESSQNESCERVNHSISASSTPLDSPVTAARRARCRLLIHIAPKISVGIRLLAELAAHRNYPIFSLASFSNQSGRRLLISSSADRGLLRELANQLNQQICLINNRSRRCGSIL